MKRLLICLMLCCMVNSVFSMGSPRGSRSVAQAQLDGELFREIGVGFHHIPYNIERIKELLARGANPTSCLELVVSNARFAAIDCPSEYAQLLEILELFLAHGADPNDDNGPLTSAYEPEVMRLLLEAGALINKKDRYGRTCLCSLCADNDVLMRSCPRALVLALRHHADVNIVYESPSEGLTCAINRAARHACLSKVIALLQRDARLDIGRGALTEVAECLSFADRHLFPPKFHLLACAQLLQAITAHEIDPHNIPLEPMQYVGTHVSQESAPYIIQAAKEVNDAIAWCIEYDREYQCRKSGFCSCSDICETK